jgi:hypothetical protein
MEIPENIELDLEDNERIINVIEGNPLESKIFNGTLYGLFYIFIPLATLYPNILRSTRIPIFSLSIYLIGISTVHIFIGLPQIKEKYIVTNKRIIRAFKGRTNKPYKIKLSNYYSRYNIEIKNSRIPHMSKLILISEKDNSDNKRIKLFRAKTSKLQKIMTTLKL